MAGLKLEDVDDRQLGIDDIQDLLDAIEDVAIHYSNIGLALRIKYSELEIIEKKYQHDARNGLKEVLKLWLNLKYTKKEQDNPQWPSWRKVVEVVDKSWAGNNHALAIEIANAHPYRPGAIGKPEREAKMREVNTTTTEETSIPSTEVPLPPSQDVTEPARSQTAQPLDRPQPRQPVGVSHSAPVSNKDEQFRLFPPGYFLNKSGTECPTKASNQNASSAQATPPSQSQSSAQELERDFSRVVGLSQQPSNSTAPSSHRGLTSSMATSDAQYHQAFQSAQTGDYPLQSMSHNDYPPRQVPTQQVLPTSPLTRSDPNSKLVDGSGPPRPTAVYSGTQPTEAGSDRQVLITPSSAVTKNFTSDSEVDLPSEGASPNSTLNAQGKTASRLKRGGAHHGAVGEKSQEPATQQRQSAVQPSPTQPPVSQPHPPPSVPHPQPSGDQHQHAGYFYPGPYGVPPNPNVQGTTGPHLQYIAGHHNSGAAGSVHHPQCPPGMQAPGHYWPMQFPYGYYPSAAGYFPSPWGYYPLQPTMPPQQDVPAQYRAGAALPQYPSHVPPPPAAHPPHSSPALETQQSENEEISEGSVAGTPHEAKSQDEGELYSEKVLRYEAVTPQVATDLGKKRPGHIVPNVYYPYARECKFNKIGLSFSHSIIKPAKPEEGAKKPDNTYGMTCCPHGYAVIINNCSFRKHDTRDGTNVDCRDLVLTFQYLGYRVEEHSNLTSSQITQLFEDIRWRDHSDFDSFVCCILSHGKNNFVYGSDSKKVEVKNLTYKLSSGPCPSLTGKPKLFFIQACRGSFTGGGAQTDGGNAAVEKCSLLPSIETPSPGEAPAASDATISTVADFFVGYSTSADYVSYRDPQHGSWYIWELCDALCNWSTCKPLRDIMDTVHERVNVEHSSLTERQAPDYSCSLMKKVFFW